MSDLMTLAEVRARVETAIADDSLQQLVDDCEKVISDWAGPLVFDEDEAEDVTETVYARGRTLLRLTQTPAAIVSVSDWAGDTETELDVDDDPPHFRIRGEYVERAGYYWGDRTVVTYTPADARHTRRLGLVKLVQLEINFQPGFSSQGAGPWNERYAEYVAQRQEILSTIREPDLFA